MPLCSPSQGTLLNATSSHPLCLLPDQPCWVQVCYPKRTDRPLYHGLVTQCESLAIPFISMEDLQQQCQQQQQQQQQQEAEGAAGGGLSAVCDVVIDALFGFSFKGTPRPPFDTLLQVRGLIGTPQVARTFACTRATHVCCNGWD
jgi:hypothetical protein